MAGRKFKRLGKGRKRHGRKILKYFLIVCEGQKTEPHYFKGLKRQLSKGVLRQIEIDIRGIGANTQSLVKKALEIKSEIEFDTTRPIDQVWVVFDRDSFKKQQFNQAVAFCEQKSPLINAAWSNEAFELWYLLHFDDHRSALSRTQYQKKLESCFKNAGLTNFRYAKNHENMFTLLDEYGSRSDAIRRCKALNKDYSEKRNYADHNPCTQVHLLVEDLLKYKPS